MVACGVDESQFQEGSPLKGVTCGRVEPSKEMVVRIEVHVGFMDGSFNHVC